MSFVFAGVAGEGRAVLGRFGITGSEAAAAVNDTQEAAGRDDNEAERGLTDEWE